MSRRVIVSAVAQLAIAIPLLASAQAAPTPCTGAEHRQFDFWRGEWDVVLPNGTQAGTNVIEEILSGCALRETWTGAGPSRGTSLNFYDPATREWHQLWVDNSGLVLRLHGGVRDGSMVLEGSTGGAEGETVLHRIAWTPRGDGEVRQHWESSTDGGASWRTVFDGRYVPRRASAP